VHIDVSLASLTPEQARQVHAALGEILDRITTPPPWKWWDSGSGPGYSPDDTEDQP
jgi:hypothetical protein